MEAAAAAQARANGYGLLMRGYARQQDITEEVQRAKLGLPQRESSYVGGDVTVNHYHGAPLPAPPPPAPVPAPVPAPTAHPQQHYEAIYEEQQPDGTWKEVRRQRLT